MKKAFLIVLFLTGSLVFADGNYKGGNGTLLYNAITNGMEIDIRKFELKNVHIGDMLDEEQDIYDDYKRTKKIGTVSYLTESEIDIHQICSIRFTGDLAKHSDSKSGELWLKISTKKTTGWICIENIYNNIYENNNYEFLETIKSGDKIYNIRKFKGFGYPEEDIIIKDKPGLNGKEIATLKKSYDYSQYIEITEEWENGNENYKAPWVKIEYEKGKFGWTDGHYLSGNAGGPFYRVPEIIIPYYIGELP